MGRQARDAHREAFTVKELSEEYIEKHAKIKKTSWQEDERILNKDVIPVLGNRKAKDVSRRDILTLLEGMHGRGDGIITNTFKIIRRVFTFAVKKEIVKVSPCFAFERGEELPKVQSRERTLTEVEIKLFWLDLEKTAISKDVRRILKLILLTGQRPGEVAAMHRGEISGRWWEFTPKETAITKETPRQQRVYLTDTALQLIGEGDRNEYVFKIHKAEKLNPQGEPENPRHITERAISHALRRNLLRYEPKKSIVKQSASCAKSTRKNPFVVAADKKMDIEHFTPHDLRRTCATLISELGFVDATVDAILAHLKKGEIRTYNKNKYDKEKQEALTEWAIKLDCIIAGSEYRNPQQREDDRKAEEEKKVNESKDNVISIEQGRKKAA
jgi:integrase